jgi:hypothetical protein
MRDLDWNSAAVVAVLYTIPYRKYLLFTMGSISLDVLLPRLTYLSQESAGIRLIW